MVALVDSERRLLSGRVRMYEDILTRERLTAEKVTLVFGKVEFGWLDTSVVVDGREDYFFSFSDINDDLHDFVDWLALCCGYEPMQTVCVDCESERLVFTLMRLNIANERRDMGLLSWYDDMDPERTIRYHLVDIRDFIATTYLSLLRLGVVYRQEILAFWEDDEMRGSEELVPYDLTAMYYDARDTMDELPRNVQLLFYNKMKRRVLDQSVGDLCFCRDGRAPEVVDNVVFVDVMPTGDLTFADAGGRVFGDVSELMRVNGLAHPERGALWQASLGDDRDQIEGEILRLREILPGNVDLYFGHIDISVGKRSEVLIDQTPFEVALPILIPKLLTPHSEGGE